MLLDLKYEGYLSHESSSGLLRRTAILNLDFIISRIEGEIYPH